MSTSVLVIGESGTGKSTAIRTLDSKSTYIINVIDKPLPFKGWGKNYKRDEKEKGRNTNYFSPSNHTAIINCLDKINKDRDYIKTVIIDDFQYVMANEFMSRALERGYDKFTEIALHVWDIIKKTYVCRKDLTIIFLSHSEISESDGKARAKTIGKLLNDKITVEGMFTIVLQSGLKDGEYVFKTQGDECTIAKSPLGMFESKYIPNDLQLVVDSINKYNEGE
jgi:adenylate kinase family enzyme